MARLLASCALLFCVLAPAAGQSDLADGFKNPPTIAAPHTWWHWMNGNITREGITADLEAMKRIALGGAQVFNVSESIPPGPILYMSPEWLALFKHAAAEADRLGLELCMHNCAGWSSSGGPWIDPAHAMQMVVTSETPVQGPRHFAEALTQPETRLGFYRDIAVLAFPTPADPARIKDLKFKAGYDYRYDQQPSLDALPAAAVIKRDSIIDLTARFADGRLTWDVPEGAWTILRLGYTPTGARNAPAPDSGRGLECDKLSKDGLDAHWAGGIVPVLKALGPLAGKALNNCLIDSYEMGGQNWTPRFREEFARRRGYDPLPYLPAMTGRAVESGESSERFLWDVRRSIADLFADNYYSHLAELCHDAGLRASIEPYDGPFECLLAGRDADIPMGEFWVGGGESPSCKLAASVAHTYGRPIVGAESFTAEPGVGRWLNHPYSLKGVGDLMYTAGINRYIVHRYAHQPWRDVVPGMTMGQWGAHFERTTTWWNQGAAWVRYLTRCQYLLQQGRFAADALYLTGDAAPHGGIHKPELKAKGYDYDSCNPDVLLRRVSVKDGRLVLPDGVSYRLLVLPQTTFMTPRTLERIRTLVQEGATVLGPRPERSPSLENYPACDQAVRTMAREVWGETSTATPGDHTFGRGRVITGRTPEEALAAMGVAPDCSFGSAPAMAWIHRIAAGADVYFLSNQRAESREVSCTFRIAGKSPELWHADAGLIEPAPVWNDDGRTTTVPIRFDAFGSVFVVFRAAPAPDHVVAFTGPEELKAPPPRIEIRKAVYEATDGAGSADVTAKVVAMVRAGQTSITANNTSFGDPTYLHVKRLRVEFTLDGRPLNRTAPENGTLELVPPGPATPAPYRLALSDQGAPILRAFRAGQYRWQTAPGKSSSTEVKPLPPPIQVSGPWTVRFQPGRGGPPSITLDRLASLSEHADPGVKYFSGTAEYETELDVPSDLIGPGKLLELDLGDVQCIAEVSLNGSDLGTFWKPPFAPDISQMARPGKNTLVVRVTNLWVNRLIGDEQLPPDCEWNGKPLKAWPQWLLAGQPRPTQRITFTTWRHYTKDSELVPSGLIGPVVVRPGVEIK